MWYRIFNYAIFFYNIILYFSCEHFAKFHRKQMHSGDHLFLMTILKTNWHILLYFQRNILQEKSFIFITVYDFICSNKFIFLFSNLYLKSHKVNTHRSLWRIQEDIRYTNIIITKEVLILICFMIFINLYKN